MNLSLFYQIVVSSRRRRIALSRLIIKYLVFNIQPYMKRDLIYVATSRATTASGLFLKEQFKKPNPPPDDDPVVTELNRMKTTNQLFHRYKFIRERNDFSGIQFMYHNIQSMPKHFEDMIADPCFGKHNDLILLVETWTLPRDNFVIPGFEMVGRIDSDYNNRKPSGVIAYANNRLDRNTINYIEVDTKTNNVQMSVIYILYNLRFALFYASPQASTDEILNVILQTLENDEECKTVLVGDFNTNFNSPDGLRIMQELQLMNLYIRTNPTHFTTRGYSTIDAIFSNQSMRTGVYMSTYSYHFPLYGMID